MFEIINPKGQGFKDISEVNNEKIEKLFNHSKEELYSRVENCVYKFLNSLYNDEIGALHHFYRATDGHLDEIDSGNFLMVLNYLTVYDQNGDEDLLEKAASCYDYAYKNYASSSQPMFTWQGGVIDGFKNNELYVKYTGDAFIAANALYRRTKNERYLFDIKQYHNFFKQAKKNDFAYKFDTNTYKWSNKGFVWQSFGFPVCCYLEYYDITKDEKFLKEAIEWGNHGLSLQEPDGGFYLIDGEFWNSDLTAPELRALIFLYQVTDEEKYLNAAKKFADWLISQQSSEGAWPIGIDLEQEVCAPNIGPGDIPNIAISLILLHSITDEEKYLSAIIKAIKYSLLMQAVEDGKYPLYLEDEHVKYGFWSWEPLLDYTLSGDQSVHHIRGILYAMSYLG